MKRCPKCNKMYSSLVSCCPDCKVPLVGEYDNAPASKPPVQPVNPPGQPVNPPVRPVTPPVQPVNPPVRPVTPPVQPVNPPVRPVTPPVQPVNTNNAGSHNGVSFGKAIKLFFKHYGDFSSRSCRSEFWWSYLFVTLISIILGVIFAPAASLWCLAIFIPNLAINVRRLHDVGKSGWWLLMVLIPLVGLIFMLVIACTATKGANQWGSGPNQD